MNKVFAVLFPVNRNVLASTITLVVGYLHPLSQGKGSNGNSTSVQSNEHDAEPYPYIRGPKGGFPTSGFV